MSHPESVLSRSSRCDLSWPQFRSVSQQELDLPLAYVITAFSDPRNVELSLATIFRPHNSYCVHIDPKSSKQFRWEFHRFHLKMRRNLFSEKQLRIFLVVTEVDIRMHGYTVPNNLSRYIGDITPLFRYHIIIKLCLVSKCLSG